MAEPIKRKKAIDLALGLRKQGLRIDGIGAQAHWTLNYPSLPEIQQMISDIVEAGLLVKISELDVSVYTEDDWNSHTWQAERPFDEALAQAQAARYREIFEVFSKNAEHITSVTIWGVSDDRTWLDSFPAGNRDNYPLLFDEVDRPKPAYFALFDVTVPAR
jgi:endo-1,4-beta-xylanase